MRCLGAIICLSALSACGNLLPHGSSVVASPFDSFEAARHALERAEPYRTTAVELRVLGFDLQSSANVRQIPYPEVITRLAPNPAIPLEMLDLGIRDCIAARQACRAYVFTLGKRIRRREGPFLLDFLNFRRTVAVSGWQFEGLVVMRDGVVLFRSYGGEPLIELTERQTNPLGPLQPAGESSGALLIR